MRLSLVVLIGVVVIGGIVVSLGFLTNQDDDISVSPLITSPYEKLEKYKNELEKINLYNQQILEELEEKIKNFDDDSNIDQTKEEIQIVKRVIDENNRELEEVRKKLSEMNRDT